VGVLLFIIKIKTKMPTMKEAVLISSHYSDVVSRSQMRKVFSPVFFFVGSYKSSPILKKRELLTCRFLEHGPLRAVPRYNETDIIYVESADFYFNLARKTAEMIRFSVSRRVEWTLIIDTDNMLRMRAGTIQEMFSFLSKTEATPSVYGDVMRCLNQACQKTPFLRILTENPYSSYPPIPWGGNTVAYNIRAAGRILPHTHCLSPFSDRSIGLWAYATHVPVKDAPWSTYSSHFCSHSLKNYYYYNRTSWKCKGGHAWSLQDIDSSCKCW
jgi:hypothetical protein